jgi:hypothetical protein
MVASGSWASGAAVGARQGVRRPASTLSQQQDTGSIRRLRAFAGNRAVTSLIGRPFMKPALRRQVSVQRYLKLSNTALSALTDHSGATDLPAFKPADAEGLTAQLRASRQAAGTVSDRLAEYLRIQPAEDEPVSEERLRDLQTRLSSADLSAISDPLVRIREGLVSTTAFSDVLAVCREIGTARSAELRTLKINLDRVTTKRQQERTLGLAGRGELTHMIIAPPVETGQALGEMFPEGMKPEDQPLLRLPKKTEQGGAADPFRQLAEQRLTIGGGGPKDLEVLYVGGSHGGTMGLFEDPESPNMEQAFDTDYWAKAVIAPLVTAGIRARWVVLDACHTAQSAGVFAPLLAADGKIIATMIETNGNLLDRDTWTEVLAAIVKGRGDVAGALAARLRKASRDRTTIFAVYLPEASYLMYDNSVKPSTADQHDQMEMSQAILSARETTAVPTSTEEILGNFA